MEMYLKSKNTTNATTVNFTNIDDVEVPSLVKAEFKKMIHKRKSFETECTNYCRSVPYAKYSYDSSELRKGKVFCYPRL